MNKKMIPIPSEMWGKDLEFPAASLNIDKQFFEKHLGKEIFEDEYDLFGKVKAVLLCHESGEQVGIMYPVEMEDEGLVVFLRSGASKEVYKGLLLDLLSLLNLGKKDFKWVIDFDKVK